MNKLKTHHDEIVEKLDELADLSEHWRRNRDKGHNLKAIRTAMVLLANDVTMIARQQDRETAEMMDKLCGPTAYYEIHSS